MFVAMPFSFAVQMIRGYRLLWLSITLRTGGELAGHASVGLGPPLLQEELLAKHGGIGAEVFGGVACVAFEYVQDGGIFNHLTPGTSCRGLFDQSVYQISLQKIMFWPFFLHCV